MEAILLIGRIIFGGYFIFNGMNHLWNVNMMTPYTAAKGVPFPRVAVLGSGVLLLLGGISILLGLYAWVGAILVIVFLVPTTLIMHRFWGIADRMQSMMEMTMFLKNLALIGAAAMLWYFTFTYGSGPLSLG